MLNPDQKLNDGVFGDKVERVSMRQGFGEGLVRAADIKPDVVALCADLTESTQMSVFRTKYPERFVELGVAEQNLAAVASGMAAMGKIPFMASYAIFSPGRNWEQIRTTIAYNNVPVKIVSSHCGVNVGPDGGSHQALEDIALMRVLPRMTVISPCDAIEARKATLAASTTKEPTYIRLTREKSPLITTDQTPFEIGKAAIVYRTASSIMSAQNRKGRSTKPEVNKVDIGIVATGALLYQALKAAKRLEDEGRSVIVMNLATVKPLDGDAIIKLAHESGALVTVEEHQIAGGMGSAVAECLARHFPVPIEFIGVKDRFGQSGTASELIELYEMGESHIYKAVNKVLMRK